MKIAIIGAGFTGLAAAHELLKKNHEILVLEKDDFPGGLAVGFKLKGWKWTLEKHYHHWFTNDTHIIDLAKELNHKVIVKRPKTSVYVNSQVYQLDSPLKVLQFPLLSIIERLRMGLALAFLRFNPFWRPLERVKAATVLPILMGDHPYRLLWKPLLDAKFSKYSDQISLAWFWARISKRTQSLAYPEGGFLKFAQRLSKEVEDLKGKINYGCQVEKIINNGNKVLLRIKNKKGVLSSCEFDKVIVTLPASLFAKITEKLPNSYIEGLSKLRSVGAINMILQLKEEFFKDNTYWLSICQESPILAIVEHTNYMDKKFFDNQHLVYLGNYLPTDHAYYKLSPDELLKEYDPFLKKLNKNYKKNLIDFHVFKNSFAQPVIPVNYSKVLPSMRTPLKNVFLANIQQVYPWDRGTTYAVEIGKKVAKLIMNNE